MAFEEDGSWMESVLALGSYLGQLPDQTGNRFCILEDGLVLSANYDVIYWTT